MIAKCKCQNCNASIEFDTAQFEPNGDIKNRTLGQMVECPHCQKLTTIYIEKVTSPLAFFPQEHSDEDTEIPLLAYFMAIILPIIGFFFGIYLMTKKQAGHGCAVMALSVTATTFWTFMLI